MVLELYKFNEIVLLILSYDCTQGCIEIKARNIRKYSSGSDFYKEKNVCSQSILTINILCTLYKYSNKLIVYSLLQLKCKTYCVGIISTVC